MSYTWKTNFVQIIREFVFKYDRKALIVCFHEISEKKYGHRTCHFFTIQNKIMYYFRDVIPLSELAPLIHVTCVTNHGKSKNKKKKRKKSKKESAVYKSQHRNKKQ